MQTQHSPAAQFTALTCQRELVVPVQIMEQYTAVKRVGKQAGGNSLSALTFFPWVSAAPLSLPKALSDPLLTPPLLSHLQSRADHKMARLHRTCQNSSWDATGGYCPFCCLPPASIDTELYFYT